MKKKLFTVTIVFIIFVSGFFMGAIFYHIKNSPLLLSLCHKKLLTADEKKVVLSTLPSTKNPFFDIPDWYDKQDLLKTKNFYIKNSNENTDDINVLESSDIYSWKNNAYLEFEDGSFYDVQCSK